MKNLNKVLLVILVLLLILLAFLSGYYVNPIAYISKLVSSGSNSIEVVYENLTLAEEEYSAELIGSLKPDYYSLVEKVVFTKTLPAGCENADGCHFSGGIAYVKWRENDMDSTLCHELLHGLIPIPKYCINNYDCPEHRIIKELAEEGVCYKGSQFGFT